MTWNTSESFFMAAYVNKSGITGHREGGWNLIQCVSGLEQEDDQDQYIFTHAQSVLLPSQPHTPSLLIISKSSTREE